MRYRVKKREGALLVRARRSGGEMINERELELISQQSMSGLLKAQRISRRCFDYTGPAAVSLSERLQSPISRYEFFYLMMQLCRLTQRLAGSGLFLGNLLLDLRYVYINQQTKVLHFIYLPLTSNHLSPDFIAFMMAVIYAAQPLPEQDKDYLVRFHLFLTGMETFDAQRIQDYVVTEEPALNLEEQMPRERKRAEPVTCLLREENADLGATVLLTEERRAPVLQRQRTGEIISLDKPVFRLGKEKGKADYVVSDNPTVSRAHLDIITRGDKHYVMDLNSTNHSYLDNELLPVRYEIEIHDGGSLRLADETFIFRLQEGAGA